MNLTEKASYINGLVDGMDLSDKATDRRAIRQRVGLVFQ